MKIFKFLILVFTISILKVNSQIFFNESAIAYGLECSFGSGFVGGGISFVDFDNDGWDDVTIGTEGGAPVLFFKNVNGSFIQLFPNIIDDLGENKQVVWIDYDNDGDKDLYVAGYITPNKLYRNDGNLNFTNVTTESGLSFSGLKNFGATWGDYDNDGFVDVFLTFRSLTESNALYRNNGDGTFTNQSNFAGISNEGHLSFCASFIDYDKDGWQDIYIANDRNWTTNIMYRNNGDGTFTDVSEETGTGLRMDAMSTTIGDYNNDGWLDIYITNTNDFYEIGEFGNVLLKNNGDGTFSNEAVNTGTSFNSIAWGAVFLDADNDRDLDLYVSGMLDSDDPLPSAFYENLDGNNFIIPSGSGFENDAEESYSNAIGDIDNDGFPEIVVLNEYANVFLWKNLSNIFNTNNWLKIKLEGVNSNRDGLGSYIEVNTASGSQYRYITCGEGYLSQNSTTEFIGLGDEEVINFIKVKWLSGLEDVIYDVNINTAVTVTEGSTLSNEKIDIKSIHFYPNPSGNNLNVSSKHFIKHVEIYNMLSQKIFQKEVNAKSVNLNISNLDTGNYYLVLYSENTLFRENFIKH